MPDAPSAPQLPSATEIVKAIRTGGKLAWYLRSALGLAGVAGGGYLISGIDWSWALSLNSSDRLEAALTAAVIMLWLKLSKLDAWTKHELMDAVRKCTMAMNASTTATQSLTIQVRDNTAQIARLQSAINEPIPMPTNGDSSGLVPSPAPCNADTEWMGDVPPPPSPRTSAPSPRRSATTP